MKQALRSAAWRQALRTAWQQRSARERLWLLAGSALFVLLLLWQIMVAPAWLLWQEAPAHQARIDAQTRQMLQWQTQAQGLQAVAHVDRREALNQLQTAANRLLGPGAQLQPQGEQLLVTLQAAPADGLAQWLAIARNEALSQPLQAQLQRADDTTSPAEATWQGSLWMRLP